MTDPTCPRRIWTALFLFLVGTELCVETPYATQRQEAADATTSAILVPATRWQPWRAPTDTPVPAAQTALRADLIRHVEETVAVRRIEETFPLAGDLLDGRTFWAAVVLPEPFRRTVVVWERIGSGWREVAGHELEYHIPGPVTPVRIEPAHAWMIARGRSGARGLLSWDVIRFDGESLHLEVVNHWFDIMLADVDGDGTLEILGEHIHHVNCYYCGMSSISFSLHRWNGVEMAESAPETLPAGSASETAVAANNRAAELAGAGRWTEALAVVDGARALAAGNAVFRRNASLIDLHVGAASLSEDTLLHYVFAGAWQDAVDIFRHQPVLPDFFTTQPPYAEEYMLGRSYGSPPFLQAVFDATAAARTVAPALPEIEFLHGWSAYHLREWTAAVDRDDPDAPTTWRTPRTNVYWDRIEADDPVVREALDRAAALAPDDPFFVEAAQVVAERADLPHADAMRRAFLLFDAGAGSCAGFDCSERPRRLVVAADTGVTPWRPWRAPDGDAGRPLADAPDGADLIRRFAAVYRDDGGPLDGVRAFPLTGSRFGERSFWAVFDPSADTLLVYERGDAGWRAVAQRAVSIDSISTVATVDIESSQAWLVVAGVEYSYAMAANGPLWEVLRFDGESLHVEVVENWLDAMIVDVDGDDTQEVLGSRARPICYECPVTRRAVRLFRWNGAKLRAVPLEFLSTGSASDAAVTANNRAVALARARRWMEAVAVLDAARPLVAESRVFRRNASLIDLNAGASGGVRLSEDDLLHHVFAGSWADVVELFRGAPAGPDLFAEPLPYIGEAARSESRYGTPPFLRAVFDATGAARAVAPARAEIEFLHAWSAFHLDPDTTVAALHRRDARYRVDVDKAAVLETLERASALTPGDEFFAEAWRVAADRGTP